MRYPIGPHPTPDEPLIGQSIHDWQQAHIQDGSTFTIPAKISD
ncbi:hypothetical protein ACTRXD_04100 [Nitrospira sp. T9]